MRQNGLRSIRRPRALGLLLLAAACSGGQGQGSGDDLGAVGAPGRGRGARVGTVTLISGDRVTLKDIGGKPATQVVMGPGRHGISMSVQQRGDELHAVPADLAALVGEGALDPQLFNVTRLLADGHGDDAARETPLVITGVKPRGAGVAELAQLAQLQGQLAGAGLSVTRTLPILGMVAARLPKGQSAAALAQLLASWRAGAAGAASAASAAAAPDVARPRVWLDARLQPLLDRSVPQIGAPAAYARGLTGAGVTVAVLDTGIDFEHPDLTGKVLRSEVFVEDGRGPEDVVGHGTHVASIVAGSGAASDGQYHGVAPAATLLNARVCFATRLCPISAIVAGMEWAVAHGADVVNISLGHADTDDLDPLELALNELSAAHDVLFVAAAGNGGVLQRVASPGSAAQSLCVGAVDFTDTLAQFSSRGPRSAELPVKPELTAPGVAIAAALARWLPPGDLGPHYVRFSGTSMATPHVAGVAALLRQQHPEWTYAEVKAALIGTALPHAVTPVSGQGAGRVDVARVISQDLLAQPPSLSFGFASFPHDDDPLVTRTLRYHNKGAQAMTLTLATELRDALGTAAPAGTLSLTTTTLQLPAQGTAEVVVTLDTRHAPPSRYEGRVVATGAGGARVVTPLVAELEVETFDLMVRALGRDGQRAEVLVDLYKLMPPTISSQAIAIWDRVNGAQLYRVPAGTYWLVGRSLVEQTLVAAPRIEVHANTEVVLDARLAQPPQLTLPEPGLALTDGNWSYQDLRADLGMGVFSVGSLWATAQLGPAAAPGELFTSVQLTYQRPSAGTAADPELVYQVARLFPDELPTGWRQSFAAGDFARVNATYGARDGRRLAIVTGAMPPVPMSPSLPRTPARDGLVHRIEHYAGEGFLWHRGVDDGIPNPHFPDSLDWQSDTGVIREYLPGQRSTETWNGAPFGPGFRGFTIEWDAGLPSNDGTPRRDAGRLVLLPSMLSAATSFVTASSTLMEVGTATLTRDGEPFAEAEPESFAIDVAIPEESARYRLETRLERPAELFELSTRVEAAWSFELSGGGERIDLPLPTLRFFPALDRNGRSSTAALVLPIHVARPEGVAGPRLAETQVEVSFDDGASWRLLPLLRFGDRAFGLVLHPRGAHHVSLRGRARDVAGHEVEQTIVRAYGLSP